MKHTHDFDVRHSHTPDIMASAELKGWCVHAICFAGTCRFTYNGRTFSMEAGDVAIISFPENVTITSVSPDLRIEAIAAPGEFLNGLLPANHYGIGGGISLFDDPLIHLSEAQLTALSRDFDNILMRLGDTGHRFYRELIGSLFVSMIYDLFDFHSRGHAPVYATTRSMHVVRQLTVMLAAGRCREHRDVAYYADRLSVTPKYLSDTVRRQTGHTVTYYIDRYAVQMVRSYLDNPQMSITQIADEMHFSSVSYFCRYVAKHLGMSPGQYRASLIPG